MIVGVLIIALIIGSIARIISVHYATEDAYTRDETLTFLQSNSTNIVRKVNTKSLAENDIFYIYKDTTNKRFLVMTGATADQYKYIDSRSEWVSNTGSFESTVYTQIFLVDKNDTSPTAKQVIK